MTLEVDLVSPEMRCPRCRTVIPPLASACLQCGMETLAVDDQRFSVVRKGQTTGPAAMPGQALPPTAPPEAARVQEGERVWYCRIGGQTIGPVQAADIRDAFSKGQIDGNATVGIRGRKDWFPIRSLPQFADMITGIGRPPTARSLPAPAPGGAALPTPQQPRRPANAVGLSAAPRGGASLGLPPPGWPSPAAAAPPAGNIGRPTGAPAADPDDETQVVPPLPPPTALPGAQVGATGSHALSPGSRHAMQDEIAKLRRMVLALGVLSGVLLLSAATLLMLWLSA